jgi:hypothetical protein
LQRRKKKLEVLQAIADGIREVKEAQRKGIQLQSLDDFLKKLKSESASIR